MNMQKIHLSRKRIFCFIAALFCLFQLAAAFLFRSTEAGSVAASARALLAHGGVAGVITGVITIAVLTGLVLSTALLFLPNATRFTGRFCALFTLCVQAAFSVLLLLLCWLGVGAPARVSALFGGERVYPANYVLLLLSAVILGRGSSTLPGN